MKTLRKLNINESNDSTHDEFNSLYSMLYSEHTAKVNTSSMEDD